MQVRGNVVNDEVLAKLRILAGERTACRDRANMLSAAYDELEQSIENNVYTSLTLAQNTLERWLNTRAEDDCVGEYNIGEEVYTQDFIVDGKQYTATLKCEYNRYDKTYNYVEYSHFSYAEKIN